MPAGGLLTAGLIAGGVGAVGKIITGIKQGKEAKKIKPVYNPYQISPYAKQRLGMAQQLYNGRMAGAANVERNIAANQAGMIGQVGRNATDSSQALALAMGTQGAANQAYGQLGQQEVRNQYSLLDNLNEAQGGMIREGDKVFADHMNKYGLDVTAKNNLTNAQHQNIFGGIGDVSSMLMMGAQASGGGAGAKSGGMGMQGGFGRWG